MERHTNSSDEKCFSSPTCKFCSCATQKYWTSNFSPIDYFHSPFSPSTVIRAPVPTQEYKNTNSDLPMQAHPTHLPPPPTHSSSSPSNSPPRVSLVTPLFLLPILRSSKRRLIRRITINTRSLQIRRHINSIPNRSPSASQRSRKRSRHSIAGAAAPVGDSRTALPAQLVEEVLAVANTACENDFIIQR